MSIENILVFTENKFDERDYLRFGIELFLKSGYNVEVYEFTHLLRSNIYLETYNPAKEIQDDYVIKVLNHDHFISLLEFNDPYKTIIASYIGLGNMSKGIFQIVSKMKFEYAVFRTGIIPDIDPFYKVLFHKGGYSFKYNVLYKIKSAKVAFLAGKKAKFKLGSKINRKTTLVNVGSIDYNTYTSIKENLAVQKIEERTPEIVFIDEYYPLHPDLSGEEIIDTDYYYTCVNRYLKAYSRKMNMTCGIAVHPRADYSGNNPFDFDLYFNKTPELIIKSKIVIGHASTSFSFAVLSNKPIIQIGFKQTEKTIYGKALIKFSSQLGTSKCYLDIDYDMPKYSLNEKKYRNYIENYILSDDSITVSNSNEALILYLSK